KNIVASFRRVGPAWTNKCPHIPHRRKPAGFSAPQLVQTATCGVLRSLPRSEKIVPVVTRRSHEEQSHRATRACRYMLWCRGRRDGGKYEFSARRKHGSCSAQGA